MNKLFEGRIAQDEIDGIQPGDWNSSSGTFDPVEADAGLAGMSGPSTDGSDSGIDALAEYMERETAYVDAAPPTGAVEPD
jgi:hypothetical protein